MKILLIVVLLIAGAVGILYLFPQINFREMPEGLMNGKLSEEKPNWVSSFVAPDNMHYIAPLNAVNLSDLSQCMQHNIPQITITHLDKTYLLAYRQSRVFHFVDWLVIYSDGNVVSSATMGYSDLGKNRELVEQIRTLCH
ncbi:DUF1499 domain-containing protein [Legionella worsleiensis]|uniref:DUF1499 domain-containing protein n=1 Tax=Legionella worsleiensis TaxID=45076 RepID=A0A0W1AA55_9GAMM|nr:DUF1499 domain-containing protein [Legionella worsleiensis]KTD78234.1 hypothetical protein Lwor_1629 [Legionella worsleiensis]STY32571.1 Uncharacterized protein conserved in bacteria [Legionella worsleiensis]